MKLSVYPVRTGGVNPTVGALIASDTISASMLRRTEANARACNNGDCVATEGYFYDAIAVPITFYFSLVPIPTAGVTFSKKIPDRHQQGSKGRPTIWALGCGRPRPSAATSIRTAWNETHRSRHSATLPQPTCSTPTPAGPAQCRPVDHRGCSAGAGTGEFGAIWH